MDFKTLKCPHCGATLDCEDSLETFYCKYCGQKVILSGQSSDIINAKVKLKGIELLGELRDKHYQAKENSRAEREKEREQSRKQSMWAMLLLAGLLIFCLVSVESRAKNIEKEVAKMDSSLQASVVEILDDIEQGSYAAARIKAGNLYFTVTGSNRCDELTKKWDNTRNEILAIIDAEEAKAESNIE